MDGPSKQTAEWIEHAARLGYGAKALLYGTIGLLAGKAALGQGGATTDTRGAMSAIAQAPFGRVLMALTALGLTGYAIWRIVAAITDAEGRGKDLKGVTLRGSFVVRAIFHLLLAWSAIRIAAGRSVVSRQKLSAAGASGEWLLALIGLGVLGYGLYQIYRALAGKLSRQINRAEMVREAGRWAYTVARFGIAARGVVFCLIGYLTVQAARNHRPNGGGGVRESLDLLASMGKLPLAVAAAGFLAYAFYEVLNVRYREIRA
ncbi:MAG: DUF1206 domain-containing protein [Gemmatimonadota bacterium]